MVDSLLTMVISSQVRTGADLSHSALSVAFDLHHQQQQQQQQQSGAGTTAQAFQPSSSSGEGPPPQHKALRQLGNEMLPSMPTESKSVSSAWL